MRPSRVLTVTAVAAVFALSGCGSSASVDLNDARTWADEVVAAESDGPGAAATGVVRVGTGDGTGLLDLGFEQPTTIVRIDVRCFDGDLDDVTATVTAILTHEGGSESSADDEVTCDRDPHELVLDAADAIALEIRATATAETYLHATVIQELVIERE